MFKQWELPLSCDIQGKSYEINTDYRDILQIISILQSADIAERVKVRAVLSIFYTEDVPNEKAFIKALMIFINCGESFDGESFPKKLMDWEQDYQAIAADINKSAGFEVRAQPYIHWFTFISYFKGIGEGQLSNLVAIRDKLRKGKKLEKWESDFYLENRDKVILKQKYSDEEQDEIDRLLKIIG